MRLRIVLRLGRLNIVTTNLDSLLFTSSDLADILALVAIGEERCVALRSVLQCNVVITSRIKNIERVSKIRCVFLLLLINLLEVEKMAWNFSSTHRSRLLV